MTYATICTIAGFLVAIAGFYIAGSAMRRSKTSPLGTVLSVCGFAMAVFGLTNELLLAEIETAQKNNYTAAGCTDRGGQMQVLGASLFRAEKTVCLLPDGTRFDVVNLDRDYGQFPFLARFARR